MFIGIFKGWLNKFPVRNVVGIFFCFSLCGYSFFTLADKESTGLKINDAWVRLAPPGAKANAAYATLYNPSREIITIKSLSAICCERVMLHRTRYENDRAIMEHLDLLSVLPQSSVELIPGGLHVMLLNPSAPLRAGDSVEIQLHFSDGRQQRIQLPVKSDDN